MRRARTLGLCAASLTMVACTQPTARGSRAEAATLPAAFETGPAASPSQGVPSLFSDTALHRRLCMPPADSVARLFVPLDTTVTAECLLRDQGVRLEAPPRSRIVPDTSRPPERP